QDTEAKISLGLRVQEIGGGQRFYSLKGAPGDGLNAHVAGILSGALQDLSQRAHANRKDEAVTKLARGIERSRVNTTGALGGYMRGDDDEKRLQNISEAIEAFQAAILLDPDNAEAKLDLAICLIDRGIGKKEAGRDYLSEVITSCPDSYLVHRARRELAR